MATSWNALTNEERARVLEEDDARMAAGFGPIIRRAGVPYTAGATSIDWKPIIDLVNRRLQRRDAEVFDTHAALMKAGRSDMEAGLTLAAAYAADMREQVNGGQRRISAVLLALRSGRTLRELFPAGFIEPPSGKAN